jgi:hypothetical protein
MPYNAFRQPISVEMAPKATVANGATSLLLSGSPPLAEHIITRVDSFATGVVKNSPMPSPCR